LNNVPEYAVAFTQLILLSSLVSAIIGPLWMSIQATGDIKKYQLIVSCFLFASLPLSFLILRIGFSPVWVLVIRVGLDILTFIWRILFLRIKIKLPITGFFFEVIVPIFIISGVSSVITVLLHNLFTTDWNRLIMSCIISTVTIGCFVWLFGLNRQEKKMLLKWLNRKHQ